MSEPQRGNGHEREKSQFTTFDPPQTAALIEYNAKTKQGSLNVLGVEGRVNCHESTMCKHLQVTLSSPRQPDQATPPIFVKKISAHSGKQFAVEVECRECATETIWELKLTGKEVWGVPEYTLHTTNKPQPMDGENSIAPDVDKKKLDEANAPYYEVKKKKERFHSRYTSDDHVDEFGKPEELRQSNPGSDYIILSYPMYGERTVHWRDLYTSRHFKKESTPDIRVEKEMLQQGVQIEDGPVFFAHIATLNPIESLVPRIEDKELFASLPTEQREKIIHSLQEALPTPEASAQQRWDFVFGEKGKKRQELDRAMTEIVSLQSPREAFFRSESYDQTITVPGGRWVLGNIETKHRVNQKYLIAGAKKIERPGAWGDYSGGSKFAISDTEEPKEQIQANLLIQRKAVLERLLEEANVPAWMRFEELDMYAENPQQWRDAFFETYENIRSTNIAAIHEQIEKRVAEERTDDVLREEVGASIKRHRVAMQAVETRCIRAGIKDIPHYQGKDPDLGSDSLSDVIDAEKKMSVFLAGVDDQIQTALAEKKATEIRMGAEKATEAALLKEAMEAQGTPAPWCVLYIPVEELQKKFGRKPGEGFGNQLIGDTRSLPYTRPYLPGDAGLVALRFGGTSSHSYKDEVRSVTGLRAISEFPTSAGKTSQDLLGLVEDPNWSVAWVSMDKRDITGRYMANKDGIALLKDRHLLWDPTRGPHGEYVDIPDPIVFRSWEEISKGMDFSIMTGETLPTSLISAAQIKAAVSGGQKDSVGSGIMASALASFQTAHGAALRQHIERPPEDPVIPEPLTQNDLSEKLAVLQGAFGGGSRSKDTPAAVTKSPPAVERKKLVEEEKIDPVESTRIIATIQDRLSLIYTMVEAVSVGSDAKAKDAKRILLEDITTLTASLGSRGIATKRDKDSADGKLNTMKDRCRKLIEASPLERAAKKQLETFQEVWIAVQKSIASRAEGIISDEDYGEVEKRVKARLQREMGSYIKQEEKNITPLARLIDDVIEELLMEMES